MNESEKGNLPGHYWLRFPYNRGKAVRNQRGSGGGKITAVASACSGTTNTNPLPPPQLDTL